MLNIVPSNRFKKDLKNLAKQKLDLSLLDEVVTKLANREPLEKRHHDHPLSGNYSGYRECRVKPDWILIYRIDEGDLILFLSRTGSHSDLF